SRQDCLEAIHRYSRLESSRLTNRRDPMTLMKWLVPTFRSSCSIAAPTVTNFGKSWALANLLNLGPLYRSEVPDRTRRLWCRDFRSAVLPSAPFTYLRLKEVAALSLR